MGTEEFCLGCMAEKGTAKVCPYCGYEEGTPPASPLHLKPGTVLNRKYLIGRVLGHGGFGITYLGLDLNLRVRLAVKEYFPTGLVTRDTTAATVSVFSGDSRQSFDYGLEKFLEEGRTLARFDDVPEIVGIRDFFRENGTAYLVMDYVEGITLKEYLARQGGRLPLDAALTFVMPVVHALEMVHAAGMLHRDVSPDNIFITSDFHVKLLDFGSARYDAGGQSRSLSVMLKPGYSPEEQYRSRGKQGPWTDVYAVAATLYKLLTGETPPEALDRMAEDDLKPLSSFGLSLPESYETAIRKALSVRAGDRYRTMAEFEEALTGEVEQEAARPASAEKAVGERCAKQASVEQTESASQALGAEKPVNGPAGAAVSTPESGTTNGEKGDSPPEASSSSYVRLTPMQSGVRGIAIFAAAAVLCIIAFAAWSFSRHGSNSDIPVQAASSSEMQESSSEVHSEAVPAQTTSSEEAAAPSAAAPRSSGKPSSKPPASSAQAASSAPRISSATRAPSAPSSSASKVPASSAARDDAPVPDSTVGNTGGNISNNGLVALQGDWIYYNKGSIKFYKVKADGSGRTKLNDDFACFINAAGQWIYYQNFNQGNKLYKVRTDGSDRTKLNDDISDSINVSGDWAYYENVTDGAVYRIKTDGSGRAKLNHDNSNYLNVSNGWIYYQNSSDGNTLYKMKIDGGGRTKLNNDASSKTCVVGNWIYYQNNSDGDALYKIRTDGSGRAKITGDKITFLNSDGVWDYYVNASDGNTLYKIRTDGSGRTKLSADAASGINLAGDWIYYANMTEYGNYKIRIDGTQNHPVDSP